MSTEPRIEERAEQPYVAVRTRVAMGRIGEDAAPLLGEVFGWLAAHGAAPAGPPFFRYLNIDMERELEIDIAVPVAGDVEGDERVQRLAVPAGRYATALHTGPYDGLLEATESLLRWGDEQGVSWDATPTADGERWGARLEIYLTDPAEEPDPERFETVLAFRLAD
jgi:effector-binding domain-containing protein